MGELTGGEGGTKWLLGTDQLKARPALFSLRSRPFPWRVPELPTPPPASEWELGSCPDNPVLPSLALSVSEGGDTGPLKCGPWLCRSPAVARSLGVCWGGPTPRGAVDKGRETTGDRQPLKTSQSGSRGTFQSDCTYQVAAEELQEPRPRGGSRRGNPGVAGGSTRATGKPQPQCWNPFGSLFPSRQG